MNVVLAAEELAGVQMLQALARSSHRVVAVLAAPPQPNAGGVSVWKVAQKLGFETWPAELVRDSEFGARLRANSVDILLNVYSLYIIHREVLSASKLGAFNLHPGPLPRYAGLNAVSWAIFRGEQTHGVTVHKMEAGVDAGPIVSQSFFPIDADDTGLSLSFKCLREGVGLMLDLLDIASTDPGSIPLFQQDLAMREYFSKQVPEGGRLSWSWPARKVADFVRACDFFPFHSPWGYPRTRLGVQEFALVKARRTGLPCDVPSGTVGESTSCGVQVACSDEWILVSKLLLANTYIAPGELLRPGDHLADD
ncbi:MAG TPA: formyltransferase family protein [Terriglobales bacterium]|jgi:methionyl-tRNA formyltransferase|nr:formyltransferase family protein [Terriglobales bacterium]